jgi:hypothetical protein
MERFYCQTINGLQDKEDGTDETVDTHGELFNVFLWFLLAEDVDSKPLFLSKPLIVWQ